MAHVSVATKKTILPFELFLTNMLFTILPTSMNTNEAIAITVAMIGTLESCFWTFDFHGTSFDCLDVFPVFIK